MFYEEPNYAPDDIFNNLKKKANELGLNAYYNHVENRTILSIIMPNNIDYIEIYFPKDFDYKFRLGQFLEYKYYFNGNIMEFLYFVNDYQEMIIILKNNIKSIKNIFSNIQPYDICVEGKYGHIYFLNGKAVFSIII